MLQLDECELPQCGFNLLNAAPFRRAVHVVHLLEVLRQLRLALRLTAPQWGKASMPAASFTAASIAGRSPASSCFHISIAYGIGHWCCIR